MASSGCTGPVLAPDQLARTREIIALHLDALATDLPTVIPCLFGDEAAVSLGYTPLGLPERAGLALALHDARAALMPSPAAPTR